MGDMKKKKLTSTSSVGAEISEIHVAIIFN